MRSISSLSALLLAALLSHGCAKKAPAPAAAPMAPSTGGDRASSACGSDAANTPAHCACLGGYVRGDIGDGKVTCPQGETELERVQQGIEGAVCCKAMVQ